jgi:hypothetical protein
MLLGDLRTYGTIFMLFPNASNDNIQKRIATRLIKKCSIFNGTPRINSDLNTAC